MAIIAGGSDQGINTKARARDLPLNDLCKSKAKAKPRINSHDTDINVKMKVFFKLLKNSSSLRSHLKFSIPMNSVVL
jgi:hypothetical protein